MNQLGEKTKQFKELIAPFFIAEPQVFASKPKHYRNRAEFGVWHEGEQWYFTMVKLVDGVKTRVRMDSFDVATKSINAAMKTLQAALNTKLLTGKLFQVEFLSTTTSELLVTLIYHKPLCDQWLEQAAKIESVLGAHVIGRSRKQKLVVSQDYVTEQFEVAGKTYAYRQPEGAFTQPNAYMCQHMLEWATNQAAELKLNQRDLLELYCGLGNFTLPLSQHFRHTLATEISKTSTQAALHNMQVNHVENLKLVRLSAEEVGQALAGARSFNRLKQQQIELSDYNFGCVFVDPPRAGVDTQTLELLAGFDHLIYVSCNPETLARDLGILNPTHEVVSAALFDQFPYTHHMEAGVVLSKRKNL